MKLGAETCQVASQCSLRCGLQIRFVQGGLRCGKKWRWRSWRRRLNWDDAPGDGGGALARPVSHSSSDCDEDGSQTSMARTLVGRRFAVRHKHDTDVVLRRHYLGACLQMGHFYSFKTSAQGEPATFAVFQCPALTTKPILVRTHTSDPAERALFEISIQTFEVWSRDMLGKLDDDRDLNVFTLEDQQLIDVLLLIQLVRPRRFLASRLASRQSTTLF